MGCKGWNLDDYEVLSFSLPTKTRWWSQKLRSEQLCFLICSNTSFLNVPTKWCVFVGIWVFGCVSARVHNSTCVHMCLPSTENTRLRNRVQGSFSKPAPLAGSGLWMNNGWIQLWNRNTFHTLCKANSQSKTTTFEHWKLRKLSDGTSGWLVVTLWSEIKCSSWISVNASQNPNYVLDVPQ